MDTQYFTELLRNRKLKATANRLNLLQKINDYTSAMPFSEIQNTMDTMDRVTLYRTIETLKQQGIIHKAFQENNEVYYAICGKKCTHNQHSHEHIHFKCVNCGAVTCEEIHGTIQLDLPDYDVHDIAVHVTGICPPCRQRA